MTTRRALLGVSLGRLLVTQVGAARAQAIIPRIGLLAAGSPHPRPRPIEALIEALRDLGYVEGRTIQIEYRWAEGEPERLAALAGELVRVDVDLIVASGDAAIRAARQASRTVPIVMATSGDAVSAGFVESLARPGGNVTGMTAITPELSAKRLQILKELLPRLTRVAVLWNPTDPVQALDWNETQAAARSLGLSMQSMEFRSPPDIDRVLVALAQSPPEALVVFNAADTVERRAQLVEVAALRRYPRFTTPVNGSWRVAWSLTGSPMPISSGAVQPSLIAFLRGRNPPTCRWSSRRRSCWLSTSSRRKRWA